MTNNPQVKSQIVGIALNNLTPMVQKTILNDSEFLNEYSFPIDPILSLNNAGISIKRSELFNGIRNILSDSIEAYVTDVSDKKWLLKNKGVGEYEFPTLELFHHDYVWSVPTFTLLLSPDRELRLRLLEQIRIETNLPSDSTAIWHNILLDRSLQDEEIDAFQKDFMNTPIEWGKSVRDYFSTSNEVKISDLVPSSKKYYERLTGIYDGSVLATEYANSLQSGLLQALTDWNPYQGFLYSLFLSSHSSIVEVIPVDHLDSSDLLKAFNFLEESGDRLSQIGAIEIGMRLLATKPEIEHVLIRLIKQVQNDDIDSPNSRFKLLAGLFILVDGELSRLRLFVTAPPFYRRLVALAQASFIQSQIVGLNINFEEIFESSVESRGRLWQMQSYADMRLEPRWSPDLGSPAQFKQDFLGRIMITARRYKQDIVNSELFELIFGDNSDSIESLCRLSLSPYFPGPLEGSLNSENTAPTNLLDAIQLQLSENDLKPSSFIAIVNSARIFHLNSEQAALAAKALKIGNYRISQIESTSQLFTILIGLATVAASTRIELLADELRILIRRHSGDTQFPLEIQAAIRIYLTAAASRSELNRWRDFVGECLTELAFSDLTQEDARFFYLALQDLCHAVPELWVSCARADAALRCLI
jgi:hypothetical protein